MNSQAMSSVTKLESFEVRFGEFEGLPIMKGVDRVNSPEFTCFRRQWLLCVYPGGDNHSNDGNVAVFLFHKSDGHIAVQATLIVRGLGAKAPAVYFNMRKRDFHPQGTIQDNWGIRNFAKHSMLTEVLRDGELIIDLQMRKVELDTSQFIPKNPLLKNILEKFMDEKSADVVFEVGNDKQAGSTLSGTKHCSTTFFAHKFILQQCAPQLAELSEQIDDMTPIRINDIEPSIFHLLLYSAYGGKESDEDLKANSKDIIDAADKFGAVHLKLKAEAWYVNSTAITIDNVMENLLYADAKNCALLKEAVMDFVVDNGVEVADKVSLTDVPAGMFADLLAAVNMGIKKNTRADGGNGLSTMRISDLRRKLDERGLDVDGSRETMIAALKANA